MDGMRKEAILDEMILEKADETARYLVESVSVQDDPHTLLPESWADQSYLAIGIYDELQSGLADVQTPIEQTSARPALWAANYLHMHSYHGTRALYFCPREYDLLRDMVTEFQAIHHCASRDKLSDSTLALLSSPTLDVDTRIQMLASALTGQLMAIGRRELLPILLNRPIIQVNIMSTRSIAGKEMEVKWESLKEFAEAVAALPEMADYQVEVTSRYAPPSYANKKDPETTRAAVLRSAALINIAEDAGIGMGQAIEECAIHTIPQLLLVRHGVEASRRWGSNAQEVPWETLEDILDAVGYF